MIAKIFVKIVLLLLFSCFISVGFLTIVFAEWYWKWAEWQWMIFRALVIIFSLKFYTAEEDY